MALLDLGLNRSDHGSDGSRGLTIPPVPFWLLPAGTHAILSFGTQTFARVIHHEMRRQDLYACSLNSSWMLAHKTDSPRCVAPDPPDTRSIRIRRRNPTAPVAKQMASDVRSNPVVFPQPGATSRAPGARRVVADRDRRRDHHSLVRANRL